MKFDQLFDWGLSTISAAIKGRDCLGSPVSLTIEPTNVCNLHCPICETGAGILRRPQGFMTFEVFKKVLESAGTQVNSILLYYMGEPFLNRDIYRMIEYAVSKGIFVSVCTNGETVDAKQLVDSGISEVSFQISGMTDETHQQYRMGGDLSKTLYNLGDTIEARNYKHSKTKIRVGFIVMKHNEHEISQVIRLKEIGVDKVDIISPCVRNIEQGKLFLPESDKYWIYDRVAFDKGILKPKVVPINRCWWIYYSTVITWDGYVLPCCRDAQAKYNMGNILKTDFIRIWNGAREEYFRGMVATGQGRLDLCQLCSGYGIARLY